MIKLLKQLKKVTLCLRKPDSKAGAQRDCFEGGGCISNFFGTVGEGNELIFENDKI